MHFGHVGGSTAAAVAFRSPEEPGRGAVVSTGGDGAAVGTDGAAGRAGAGRPLSVLLREPELDVVFLRSPARLGAFSAGPVGPVTVTGGSDIAVSAVVGAGAEGAASLWRAFVDGGEGGRDMGEKRGKHVLKHAALMRCT